MGDILEPEDKERLQENLFVGPAKVQIECVKMFTTIVYKWCPFFQVPMEAYLNRFQWDSAKFPLRQPLPNIVEGISKVNRKKIVLNYLWK